MSPSYNNRIWNKLLNNGPQPSTEIDYKIGETLREDGVQKFDINKRHPGVGRHTPVYYIEGRHKPETVVKVWFENNERVTENLTPWQIRQLVTGYDPGFGEAVGELLDYERVWNAGERDTGGKCPFCGTGYSHSIADHLPDCEEKP